MGELVTMAAADVTMVTSENLTAMLDLVEVGVKGAFRIANAGFDFLMGNPLCAFVVCVGFGFTAFGMFRSAIKTAKRT